MSALLAGLPITVGGTTVNRLCGSGLDAVIYAARAIAIGEGDIYIAGGTESMTRAPFVMGKPEIDYPRGIDGTARYNDWLEIYKSCFRKNVWGGNVCQKQLRM